MPFSHIHFLRSFSRNLFIPLSRINSKFSIWLMPYCGRYRRSRCRIRSQGNSAQWQQNPLLRFSQTRRWQCTRVLGLFCSALVQPRQGLCSRKNALQIAQFIPHGAIRFLLILFGISALFLSVYHVIEPSLDGHGMTIHLAGSLEWYFWGSRTSYRRVSRSLPILTGTDLPFAILRKV